MTLSLAPPPIILASQSRTRNLLLKNAGIAFTAETADIDERAVEAPLAEAQVPPDDVALVLAEAKARHVSENRLGALVIGADQTLAFNDECLSKPASVEAARRLLLDMRGQTHALHAAVVCVRDGDVLWRHVSSAYLTMRDYSAEFVGRYLAEIGDLALTSVGAYQLEGPGVQLFEKIDGDFFTILGLPMLPLLAFLRGEGAIDT